MMPALALMLFVTLAAALSLWLPGYRLQRAIRRPFPEHFSDILTQNVPAFSRMPAELRQQLQLLVQQFLHQKKFVGCAGLHITDEIRVTIAGRACMLLLNKPMRVYPHLQLVLVYPSAFIVPREQIGIGGIVTHANQHLSGESWNDGRVILAWDHVKPGASEYTNGHDVVLHEFAHQLDSESGSTNGAPLMPTRARYQRWATVFSHEFDNLQLAAQYQFESVMDHYGATNPAEFFAVATETFFEKATQLAEFHPALFEELRNYYRVDPRDWQ